MNGQYRTGDVVLGNWTLVQLIGEGSFGRVFEAEREDFGRTYKAAIKIITIPQSQSEIKSVMADGMDASSVTAYYRTFVEELVDEFSLMSRLKGNSNVVSYEDHSVIKHDNWVGWDIIIRMELLTPLFDYTRTNQMSRKDVMQLGIDMCHALELCQKYNIVHRDIKPENIFVSDNNDFKLGDFGIARTVEKTTSGLSKKGTYTYMAPEVYKGEPYGSSVDIYSLGIVLYRLLNYNRVPFLPDYPAQISYNDQEVARTKRLSGAVLPPPKNADGRLAEIVSKACAYAPKDRYSSPMQMREELEAIIYQQGDALIIYPQGDAVPVKSLDYAVEGAQQPDVPIKSNATVSIFDASVVSDAEDHKPDASAGAASYASGAIDKTHTLFGAAPSAETVEKYDSAAGFYQQAPVPWEEKPTQKRKISPAIILIPVGIAAAIIVAIIIALSGNRNPTQQGSMNSNIPPASLSPRSSPSPSLSPGSSPETSPESQQGSSPITPSKAQPVIETVAISYGGRKVDDLTAQVGERVPLRAQIVPNDAEPDIVWSSSNRNVFEVVPDNTDSALVTVTAIGVGTGTLTVTAGDVVAECIIRVSVRAGSSIIPVTSITGITGNNRNFSWSIKNGIGTLSLSPATANPGNATNRTITWSVVSGPGSIIDGNTYSCSIESLEASSERVVIRATIADGVSQGVDYIEDFGLNFSYSLSPDYLYHIYSINN